jgi:hypothetical protein
MDIWSGWGWGGGGGDAVAGEGRSQLILNLMTTWFSSVYSEVNYAHDEEISVSRGTKEEM